jgi:hypothetical protein
VEEGFGTVPDAANPTRFAAASKRLFEMGSPFGVRLDQKNV